MPAPLSEEQRQAIANDLLGQEQPKLNETARRHGVAAGTVQSIARRIGVSFERAPTRAATQARQADMSEARSRTLELLQQRLDETLEAMGGRELLVELDREGEWREYLLDGPTARSRKDYAQAALALASTMRTLRLVDAGDHGQTVSMLERLLGAAERYAGS